MHKLSSGLSPASSTLEPKSLNSAVDGTSLDVNSCKWENIQHHNPNFQTFQDPYKWQKLLFVSKLLWHFDHQHRSKILIHKPV